MSAVLWFVEKNKWDQNKAGAVAYNDPSWLCIMWYVWPHQLKYKVTTPQKQQGLVGNNILWLLGNYILINLDPPSPHGKVAIYTSTSLHRPSIQPFHRKSANKIKITRDQPDGMESSERVQLYLMYLKTGKSFSVSETRSRGGGGQGSPLRVLSDTRRPAA